MWLFNHYYVADIISGQFRDKNIGMIKVKMEFPGTPWVKRCEYSAVISYEYSKVIFFKNYNILLIFIPCG